MRYDSAHIKEIAGYRLTERLGSGGMGDVYKAYNEALNRTAAIKVLHQKDMGDRFRNEAYIQSSVSHPNIARLYEYLVTDDMACIIMEYVDGDPLDVYRHKKGKLSNAETEHIIGQIAAALSYLHSKDIVHRDIKPQNFKVQTDGTVTMLDFGIAKNKYTPKLTQQGYMVGTTEYMAPEQFKERVEKKSDIWSLGVLTYELVTGYMPFDANNAITMRAKIEKGAFTKPSLLVPAVSGKLNTVIEKSLQVNTANRLSATAIEQLLTGKKPAHEPDERLEKYLPFAANRKMLLMLAGLILLIVLVIVIPKGPDTIPEKLPEKTAEPKAVENEAIVHTLTIDVPNAPDAYIVFPDGKTGKVPYDISGKEGESFTFRLEAEDYLPMDVDVSITIGRRSYAYNLEKIKN